MKNFLFILAIVLFMAGCAKGVTSTNTTYPDAFQKEWVHSYEESSGNVEIYRPADYKDFTPSMFRQVYHFKANGQCEYLVLHPADAHYMAKGTWSYWEDTRHLRILNEKGEQVVLFEVLEVAKDILKLQIVR